MSAAAAEVGDGEPNVVLAKEIISLVLSDKQEVVSISEVIDELRNRKGFRHWWDNYEAQDDVMKCLEERINKAVQSPPKDKSC